MLKHGLMLGGLLTGLFALVGCDNDSAVVVGENKAGSRSVTFSERGADNSWPTLTSGVQLAVAENLTASNYYVVVDGSGSMFNVECANGRKKLDVAKDSLQVFFRKLPNDANVGVFAFDKFGSGERLPLGSYDSLQPIKEVQALVAGNGTPLSTGVQVGMKALTSQAVKQLGYGEYHLVIVTDGAATSGYDPSAVMDKLLQETPIVVHTIGFCINTDHSLNRPGYTLYKSANNPQSLMSGLDAVLAESPDFQIGNFPGDS